MKRMKSKIWTVLVVIIALMMVFVACTNNQPATDGNDTTSQDSSSSDSDGGSSSSSSSDSAVEKVFNTTIGGNPTILDPIMFRDANANSIISATHEPLVRFDESGYSTEPGLAETVEHNDDYTVWTFTLRDGLKWSDGTPITTDDIVYSFQRPLNPDMASPNVNDFFIFENARDIYESRSEAEDADPVEDLPYDGMGVKADGNKIVCTLEKPMDYFLDYVRTAFFSPVQKKAAMEQGELYGTDFDKIVCSGPFILTDWQQEVSLTLEKNPNYWDADAVKISKVEISLPKDDNTKQSLYDTDAIDFMVISQAVADSGKYDNVMKIDKLGTQIIEFNSYPEIEGEFNYFSNAKIREALALTFDRVAYCNDVVNQPDGAAYGIIPYGMRGANGGDFREQQGDLVFDMNNFPGAELDGKTYPEGKDGAIAYAKDLFAAGLAECGKTQDDFEADVEIVLPNFPDTITNCEAMQAMWKQYLEVNVALKPLEMGVLLPMLINSTYQCVIGGGPTGSTYDAGEFIGFIYNEHKWDNAEYRALWEKSLEASGEERIEMIRQCEKMLCDEYVYIPSTFKYSNYVQRETVVGLRQFAVGLEYDYKYVDIVE